MSGTPKVPAPKDDEDWARNTQRRVEGLENPTAQRVGDWVISTSDAGSLIASNVNGGAVVLAAKPKDGEKDPDSISDSNQSPKVKAVRKRALQFMAAGVFTACSWDGLEYQVGEWGFSDGGTSLVVPDDGVYVVIVRIEFDSTSTELMGAGIQINGVMLSQTFVRNNATGSGVSSAGLPGKPQAVDSFNLNHGDVVQGMAYSLLGRSQGPNTTFYSSMSIIKQP